MDYMTEDFATQSFVVVIFIYSYVIPLFFLIYYYVKIVAHVSQHERSLREQAKRMNVESLRSGNREQHEKSVEVRIAKVAIGLATMYLLAWTPYAVVSLVAAFGNRSLLTPLVSMLPACFAKSIACVDPWIYAINHPRYRLELQKKLPWFCIHEPEAPNDDNQSGMTEKSAVTT